MRLEGTVLTDLSANVFAALLLILLILLQARTDEPPAATDAAGASPPIVEATTGLGSRPRAPLRAGDLVALLRDRRLGAPGLSLDLRADAVAAHGPGRLDPAASPETLAALLRATPPGAPVRLYVFAQRHYAWVAEAVARAGREPVEVSVPRALGGAAEGWSADFLGLIATDPDLPRFRAGLARLLAVGPGRAGAPAATTAAAAETASSRPSLGTRLAEGLRTAVAVGAILGGLAAVLAIEWLVPRTGARYRPRRGPGPTGVREGG